MNKFIILTNLDEGTKICICINEISYFYADSYKFISRCGFYTRIVLKNGTVLEVKELFDEICKVIEE